MLFDVLLRIRTMKTSIALSVLLVILCLVSGEFAVSSSSRLHSIENQAKQNETQLEQYHGSIKNLSQQNAAALAEERAALPNALDIPSVLNEMASVAKTAHVTLSAFQFNPTAKASQNNGALTEPNVQPYVVNVSATGRRQQILAFLAGLESYPRFSTVQTVTYEAGSNPSVGKTVQQTANITVDVYTDP